MKEDIGSYIGKFEKFVYLILIILLGVVILFSITELIAIIYRGLFIDSVYRLEDHELISLFGLFLLVIIGIELLETLKTYLKDNTIHFEIIILVALIAIARKVIILEPETQEGLVLIGIGVIIVALGGAYYLFKKANTFNSGRPDLTGEK